MKRLILSILIVVTSVSYLVFPDTSSDKYIRDNVVMLLNEGSICTGFNVVAPSGRVYLLTANHCKESRVFEAIDEYGNRSFPEIIRSSLEKDLLLLTSNSKHGLLISNKINVHDHLRTIGHGHGLPAFKMEGEMLKSSHNTEFNHSCYMPNREFNVSSMVVVGGHSGGPVVNDSGEVVGVVQAYETFSEFPFSCLAPLHSIKEFLVGL